MDGNVQRRSSRSSLLAQSPTNDDDDADTISLTSTVESEYSPDTEFVIEDVHAEREHIIDGQLQPVCLVEWANFPLDQCTWEPLANLPEVSTKQWEEKKATQDPSVALEFEANYIAAFNAKLEEARQRHRKRNAKRKRLGLPTTPFCFRRQPQSESEDEVESAEDVQDSEAQHSTPSNDSNTKCQQAAEDNAVGHKAMEASVPTKSAPKTKSTELPRPPSRVFTFEPDNAGKSINDKGRETVLYNAPESSTRPNTIQKPQKPESSSNGSKHQMSPKSGYQGSSNAGSSSSRSATAPISKAATPRPAAVHSHVPKSDGITARSPSEATRKALTGKKTTKSTMPVDVFSGGKIQRRRLRVSEAEIDSTHAPKLYNQANYRRKAELRSRDRDDQAPEFAKVVNMAFVPGSNAKFPYSAPQSEASTTELDGQKDTISQVEESVEQSSVKLPARVVEGNSGKDGPPHSGLPKRSSMSSAVADDDRPSKKAKRVHFTEVEAGPSVFHGLSRDQTRSKRFPEADDKHPKFGGEALFVEQPMDIDSNTGSTTDQPISLIASSARLSLSTHNSTNLQTVQNVGKMMTIPTSGRVLEITFEGFPAAASVESAEQWMNNFLNASCLEIGHMVLAETLFSQLPLTCSQGFEPLCSGTISSTKNNEDLDVLAEHLRIASSGLFVAESQFNLLIFPTRCAEFDGLSSFDVDPTSQSGTALKYFIFRCAVPIFKHIRSFSETAQGHRTRMGEEKIVLFPTILGIQYSALTATANRNKKTSAHFFLAFPQRALEWQRSIGSWLSTREKTCSIYTNFDPGSWLAFVEKAKIERAIIIVHEALVPFLRLFPQLAKLLLKYPVNVWHFSESVDLGPPHPLAGSLIVPAMSTKLSRLFPVGSVVLVTPSFLVSEPQAAYKFFKWFFDIRVKQGNHKLVVAYNITDYLSELSQEKSELRTRLRNDLWVRKAHDPLGIAMDKQKGALTDQDLEARQKTWLYMEWWLSQQVHSQIPFSSFNSTIFADRSIDPHDEQSLVNWFGWWSIEHSHEYRKFHVLGSSSKGQSAVAHTLTSRTSRKIRVAKYSPTVVNDPDEAIRIALGQQILPKPSEAGLQSQCFHDDENQMAPWLRSQDRGFFSKLFPFPVSWVDKTMATHYGDPTMSFKTVEQWWDSLIPWMSGSHHYNTFIGFFYTIAEEWYPDKSPSPTKPKRYPWLAIWRPVDPHDKASMYSHGKTELIIWDVRAGTKLETKQPIHLNDLTWMQRVLVKHIQFHAHEKNPDSFLEKVWLGGFQAHRSQLTSWQPADMTAEFLMRITDDLRNTVPGSAKYLFTNGWRQVALWTGPYHEEQGRSGENEDEDTRIIFHAPRSSQGLMPKGASKCINELYEAANQARLRFKAAKDMVYTYPPTLMWYQKQVAEGRHFEHVYVDEWDKVFPVMGVDKASSSSAPASGDRAAQASGRRDSGSSNCSIPT